MTACCLLESITYVTGRKKCRCIEGNSNIPNSGEIDKPVENYRKALIMHTYQQALMNQTLSKEISETELRPITMRSIRNFLR